MCNTYLMLPAHCTCEFACLCEACNSNTVTTGLWIVLVMCWLYLWKCVSTKIIHIIQIIYSSRPLILYLKVLSNRSRPPMLPQNIIQSVKTSDVARVILKVASLQVCIDRIRVLTPGFGPSGDTKYLTLLKFHSVIPKLNGWHIWIESVHKCGFYTGFDLQKTGFDPMYWPLRCLNNYPHTSTPVAFRRYMRNLVRIIP
jgi:hypothetical protein